MSALLESHGPDPDVLTAEIPSFRKPAAAASNIAAARRMRLFRRFILPLLMLVWAFSMVSLSEREAKRAELLDQAEVNRLLADGGIMIRKDGEFGVVEKSDYDEGAKEAGDEVAILNRALLASHELGVNAPDLESLVRQDDPPDPYALLFFVGLYAIFAPIILWRQPLRILLLRPFNDRKISSSIRRFVRKNLRGWGNIVPLSDRHINESVLRNSTIYAFSPRRIIGSALVLPVLPLVRLPPLIVAVRKEHHFRRLYAALKNRYNLNFFSIFDVIRKIRSSDGLWQRVVLFLIANTDLIVVDLTANKSGTLWEVEQLSKHGLLWKCIFVAEESTDAGIEASALLLGSALGKVYRYRKSGAMLEVSEFEAAVAGIVSTPARERVASRP
ncbi:hypothetical protein [Massilia sp. IC2-476]|uniref:hypothetical protein n=1 Tax=Massilia sp. IC2-476 TaxID=2887199 RepID=UPI001D109DC6|nr:hypothetical protein [Massilia sp. IC2-476]MCC2973892.1 hypothetical protein [Massilia sp. IC2-476]